MNREIQGAPGPTWSKRLPALSLESLVAERLPRPSSGLGGGLAGIPVSSCDSLCTCSACKITVS